MLAHHAAAPALVSTSHKTVSEMLAELCPDLYGRALNLARSHIAADDLVQDTVERALRFQGRFQIGTNIRGWLYQILFSVFVTRCRRARREVAAMEDLAIDPCAWTRPHDVDEISERGLSRGMKRAMRRVPKMFRQTLILVAIKEFSYKEAAQALRVPVGTIMSRLHRGRHMLAEALQNPGRRRRAKTSSPAAVKPEVKPAVKPAAKPEVKPAVKPEVKPAVKPEVKSAVKPEVKPAMKAAVKSAAPAPEAAPKSSRRPTKPELRVAEAAPKSSRRPTKPELRVAEEAPKSSRRPSKPALRVAETAPKSSRRPTRSAPRVAAHVTAQAA
jgi:RNA polymerase sigma-70 factor (ECF subfamily)